MGPQKTRILFAKKNPLFRKGRRGNVLFLSEACSGLSLKGAEPELWPGRGGERRVWEGMERGEERGKRVPAYRWCSALRSTPGCIHTCHPCKSRALHSVGGRLAGCRQGLSNPLHSGSCHPCTHHGNRSPRNRFLQGARRGRE